MNISNCPRLPLFVPGTKMELIEKAISKGAEIVIVDLEDSVALNQKQMARDNLKYLEEKNISALVRINNSSDNLYENDLIAVAKNKCVTAIVLPKSERVSQLDEVTKETGKKIIPLIETPKGIDEVKKIACHREVLTIALGHLDLAVSLRSSTDFTSLLYARSRIVCACALAGIPAPIDGITQNFSNTDEVLKDCLKAKKLGFGGKLLIHPIQIMAAKKGFCPTEEEYQQAKKIVTISSEGAVTQIDGQMIDAPIVAGARAIIRDYELMQE